MIASGENVKVVAGLLGHSFPTITQNIYQHVMPGCQRQQVSDSAPLSSVRRFVH
jgi:hypothetical protein